VLRGVAAVLFWSPLTLAFAFVSTGVAGVSWPPVLAAGGGLAALAMAVGAWSERGPRGVSGAGGAPGLVRELGPMAALCALFVAAVGATAALSGGRLIDAVLVTVPGIAALWLAVQSMRESAPLGWLAHRAAGFAARDLPEQRGEIVVLCNAAFLGAVAARLAADTDLAAGLAGLPPAVAVLIPALATGGVVLLGMAGANPLLAVALVAAPLADPAALGLSPEVVATALIAGWALSVNVTVAGASVLMLAALAGVSPGTMGRRWNGGYALRVYALLALSLTGAELVLGGGAQ